jgi:hypothetical protein
VVMMIEVRKMTPTTTPPTRMSDGSIMMAP